MATPKKKKSGSKRKLKIKSKIGLRKKSAAIVRKDSVLNNTLRHDTLKKAPFIINDNGLNMRIKIKRK